MSVCYMGEICEDKTLKKGTYSVLGVCVCYIGFYEGLRRRKKGCYCYIPQEQVIFAIYDIIEKRYITHNTFTKELR